MAIDDEQGAGKTQSRSRSKRRKPPPLPMPKGKVRMFDADKQLRWQIEASLLLTHETQKAMYALSHNKGSLSPAVADAIAEWTLEGATSPMPIGEWLGYGGDLCQMVYRPGDAPYVTSKHGLEVCNSGASDTYDVWSRVTGSLQIVRKDATLGQAVAILITGKFITH